MVSRTEISFTKDGVSMKTFLFLAVFFFLMSCQSAQDCKKTDSSEMKEEVSATSSCSTETPSTPADDTETLPDSGTVTEGDVPSEAFQFDAAIKFVNFEVDQEDKVHKAIEIIKKVISSEEFRSQVLNFSYNGDQHFVDNQKFSNAQIYQILLEGSEKLVPGKDYKMDLELELYYSSKNTVGYTYPNSLRILMNTKYFTPFTPSQVAGNIFHEWCHKLGFEHATFYSVSRDSSVPYAIGYMIRDLGKKFE
jgi:hypothetical protein